MPLNQNPFLTEIDAITEKIKATPIPFRLALKTGQRICRVNEEEVFCSGGYYSGENYHTDAFFYNLRTQKIKNLQPMNDTNEMMIQNFHRIK